MVVRIMSEEDIGDLPWGMWGEDREEGGTCCVSEAECQKLGALGS